jgi:excinuclease ABC subunit A
VLVVEHDEDMIRASDYVIDIGPGAGVHGGEVVAEGTPAEVEANPKSLTGAYLSGRAWIAVPEKRIPVNDKFLEIIGARGNNLQSVHAKIPVGLLTCVTGVSGSGKSTLINDTLHHAVAQHIYGSNAEPAAHDALKGLDNFDKVISVDQSPIGRTPRSNPATYTGLFTPIRELFCGVPAARERGYEAGRFSFNVKGGRCETCECDGAIKVEMHFLPTVYVQCDVCNGKRFMKETLEVMYKNKNIHDILNMTVDDAVEFFYEMPQIYDRVKTLQEVGLGYLELGQSATTLSGGEAQRVKIASELYKPHVQKTIYILDEPTVGLHYHDVRKLIEILQRLVQAGNTVVVIEHNMDLIKCSDYILDIGPEGGDKGGQLVAKGTPEEVANNKNSYTGHYLKKVL